MLHWSYKYHKPTTATKLYLSPYKSRPRLIPLDDSPWMMGDIRVQRPWRPMRRDKVTLSADILLKEQGVTRGDNPRNMAALPTSGRTTTPIKTRPVRKDLPLILKNSLAFVDSVPCTLSQKPPKKCHRLEL